MKVAFPVVGILIAVVILAGAAVEAINQIPVGVGTAAATLLVEATVVVTAGMLIAATAPVVAMVAHTVARMVARDANATTPAMAVVVKEGMLLQPHVTKEAMRQGQVVLATMTDTTPVLLVVAVVIKVAMEVATATATPASSMIRAMVVVEPLPLVDMPVGDTVVAGAVVPIGVVVVATTGLILVVAATPTTTGLQAEEALNVATLQPSVPTREQHLTSSRHLRKLGTGSC